MDGEVLNGGSAMEPAARAQMDWENQVPFAKRLKTQSKCYGLGSAPKSNQLLVQLCVLHDLMRLEF